MTAPRVGESDHVGGADKKVSATPTAADRARQAIHATMIGRHEDRTRLLQQFEQAVRAEAVAHERERAARVALDKRQAIHGQSPWDLACLACAAAIRAGESA